MSRQQAKKLQVRCKDQGSQPECREEFCEWVADDPTPIPGGGGGWLSSWLGTLVGGSTSSTSSPSGKCRFPNRENQELDIWDAASWVIEGSGLSQELMLAPLTNLLMNQVDAGRMPWWIPLEELDSSLKDRLIEDPGFQFRWMVWNLAAALVYFLVQQTWTPNPLFALDLDDSFFELWDKINEFNGTEVFRDFVRGLVISLAKQPETRFTDRVFADLALQFAEILNEALIEVTTQNE